MVRINVDEIITKILISMQHLTRDGLDQLKSSLYMHLGRLQIFEEETAEHVQRILGHASVQTTLQCYARLSNYVIKDAHRRYAT